MRTEWFGRPQQPARVLGIGLLALDVVERGDTVSCLRAGGTCGNVLAILSYLGWNSFPVARLNGDGAAVHIRRDLRSCDVRLDYASTGRTSATPIVRHLLPPEAGGREHRFSLRCPTCRRWLPTHQPVITAALPDLISEIPAVDLVFVDRASPAAVRLAEQMRRRGSVIVFEPSARAPQRLLVEMLALADVLKYSSAQTATLRLPRRHVRLEIETLGAAGLRYRLGRGRNWCAIKGRTIKHVRDSAGAGDWCTAGFLHALLGHRPETMRASETLENAHAVRGALTFAQALAAWNCLHEGARGAMYAVPRDGFRQAVRQDVLLNRGRQIKAPTVDLPLPARRAATVFAQLCTRCVEER